MLRNGCVGLVLAFMVGTALADGPKDNLPDQVRQIPPLGVEVPLADREALQRGLNSLAEAISRLQASKDAKVRDLLPDVQIFHRAVHDALVHNEFFVAADIKKGKELLEIGLKRAEQLSSGSAPWTTQTGLNPSRYVSKIDGSVQLYGVVVPASYANVGLGKVRLDIWLHGRGETLSEVNFLDQRLKQAGQFTPADTIVLHPYGRYSNAFKFAGEVDVLEAIDSVKSRYRVDDDRMVMRGFSMGGAGCWQFAVHYADRWVAANPGAGFSESADFLKVFQDETLKPTWYEQKLWGLYDCTDYAMNLYHCPTVAYSGEIDKQKQAADMMEAAMARDGLDLLHIIGPQMGHKYDPASAAEVERRLASIVELGRDRVPPTIHFTTRTLRYNRMGWVTVDALGEHWKPAHVDAWEVAEDSIELITENVTALTLSMPAGWCPLEATEPVSLLVDDQELLGPPPKSDRSWTVSLHREGEKWEMNGLPAEQLRKRHGLQGPIDDAFMDSFIFVRPSGECRSAAVDKWVRAEMEHAIVHWRRHFRGEARVKLDTEITEADIASSNLVLWGDDQANMILKSIADKLPIAWSADNVTAGPHVYPSEHHAPILIHPNPRNPNRYVVLNSSFTFREYDYLNNARQTPKLPDWAIVDVRTPPNSRWPGKIVAADFFGEDWKLRPERAEKTEDKVTLRN